MTWSDQLRRPYFAWEQSTVGRFSHCDESAAPQMQKAKRRVVATSGGKLFRENRTFCLQKLGAETTKMQLQTGDWKRKKD